MRTTTFLSGLVLMLGAAGAASAQPPRDDVPPRDRGAEDARGRRGRGGADAALLRGITLTDAQQQRIAELRRAQRARMDAERPREDRTRGDGGRDERARPDSAQWAQRRAEMDARRRRDVAELRGILTADQQRQFDANVAEMEQRTRTRGQRPDGTRPDGARGDAQRRR